MFWFTYLIYDLFSNGSKVSNSNSFFNIFITFLEFISLLLKGSFISRATYLDIPYKFQFGFQDPATDVMERIINLHHDIMFFLIFIVVKIIALFIVILRKDPGSSYVSTNFFIHRKDLKLKYYY